MKTKTKVAGTSKPEVAKIMGTSKKVSSSKLAGLVSKKEASKPAPEAKEKKVKEKKAKGESSRATNYNFPKDCTSARDRKKFRTTVRKKMASFTDRLAEAKSGKSKESEKAINKELAAYKAEVYLNAEA